MQLCYILLVFFTLCKEAFQQDVVANWTTVDYDWPTATHRLAAVEIGKYIPSHNVITGIKVYGDRIFVTVPRWRKGVPATMNELSNDKQRLMPYPSWEKNAIGDCNALQFCQSMEINPRDATMWIIDSGSANTRDEDGVVAHCPPKLVIIDLIKNSEVLRYHFPTSVVSPGKRLLNDIVIDTDLQRAYISNPSEPSIVVFDRVASLSWKITHPSMTFEPDATKIAVDGIEFNNNIGIDGIALSPDFKTLYYSSLNGKHVHSLLCSVLTVDANETLLDAEHKVAFSISSQTDGMIWSKKSLYFGSLTSNKVLKWSGADSKIDDVASNAETMQWVDTFAIDEKQNLWFTTNKVQQFFSEPSSMRFDNPSSPNFRIIRMHIGEDSYLAKISPLSIPNLLLVLFTSAALKFVQRSMSI